MYDYILFDLDGTLTDPSEGITRSVEYALNRLGIEVSSRSELLKFIGPPLSVGFKEFYGLSDETADKAVEYYRELFSVKGLFENEVYSGIPEMLEKLKKSGKRLAVATSKPEKFTLRILEHFDLAKYFDFIAAATLDATRNTKESVIKYALENLNPSDLGRVVMVGDRKYDIEGARLNGIASIGVLYGFGSGEELETAGASYTAETVEELSEMLLK